jgi:Predicted transcriptional regulator
MEKISPIKQNILLFVEKQGVAKSVFCEKTGISYANIKGKGLFSEIGGTQIGKILSAYPNINPEWLLTGKGSMLKTSMPVAIALKDSDTKDNPIPLVNENAVAGFGSANFAISNQDVKDYYIIPKFKFLKVDFMIEIHGSSMYPKYNSGDIIACTILHDRKFIQWNKCHIIASREQGILCKRILPSEKENCITAVSDNKEYRPFDIPEDDITGIALVVGVIRLE